MDITNIRIDYMANVSDGDILILCKFENVFIPYEDSTMLPLFVAIMIGPMTLGPSDDLGLFHNVIGMFQHK